MASWLAAAAPAWSAPGRIDFNRDVRPILSDKCYHCHGPDEKARKAKLRLDTREGVFRSEDGVTVVAPGKPAESELIRRIITKDPDDQMPPPDSNRELTPEQVQILTRWVEQGAKWDTHWSFVSPPKPAPPRVRAKQWARNGIDHFILARLEQEGLKPAEPAERDVLLRRVSIDLTGIAPTPAELDQFLQDQSSDAFERAVDRLLASPRYGERMAGDWLDVARYADTHGYQMDRYRAMWPYRDWVIKAFNENLSFDKFTTWQIAGDLLPNATKDQRLATAFNRLHMQNEEGGIVEEEYRVNYVVDRVNTFGTAFLGLTLDCTRCHDHKYDPLTMRDYYSLFAFFQNIDESGQTTYFTEAMAVPALLLSDEGTDAALAKLERQIASMEKQVPALREQARGAFAEWVRAKPAELPELKSGSRQWPGLAGAFHFDTMTSNQVANAIASGKAAVGQEEPKLAEGKFDKGAELNGENGFNFPGLGHFNRADPFAFSIWLNPSIHTERAVIFHHSRAPIDAGSRGYEMLLEKGKVAFGLHHMWPGNSLKVTSRSALATNEWTHVAVSYDGSSRAAGVAIYLNGKQASVEVIRDGLIKDITYGGGEPDLAIGFRFRDSGFKGGRVDDFYVFNRALTRLEVEHLAGLDTMTEAWHSASAAREGQGEGSGKNNDLEALLDFYTATAFPPAQRFHQQMRALRQEQNRIINPIPEAMVMKEMDKPKPAFILKRGGYDAPGDPVSPDTPSILPAFPAGAPRNRLGLAQWLLAPDNPLMARVTVNRAWQLMFGKGLVETTENFGSQGALPTHPELLDWLAREFIESGWDMKKLLKLIATSATYRQSSQASPELLAKDAANQLLGRAPVRRLSAEAIRDHALASSGLLVEKLGGPSVKPYQPEGLWEEIAMGRPRYDQSKGPDLYRRTLYTFWKRTVPHPALITFDAAERNVCVVRRQATSTPLQALALLNDTQLVEAARFIAERMLKEGGAALPDRIRWTFRLLAGRPPTDREAAILRQLYLEQREIYQADQAAAAQLLSVGEGVNDPTLPLADLAAGTALAQAIFNQDACISIR